MEGVGIGVEGKVEECSIEEKKVEGREQQGR